MSLFMCRLTCYFKVDYAPILLDYSPRRPFPPTPVLRRTVVHLIQFVTTYRLTRWGLAVVP